MAAEAIVHWEPFGLNLHRLTAVSRVGARHDEQILARRADLSPDDLTAGTHPHRVPG